jgi:PII-like signaling protein
LFVSLQNYQPAKLLRIHFTEQDRWQGKPLYEAIVDTCHALKIAGATVYRGLEGYGETAEIHKPHILTHDLPIVVQIIDSEENIQKLLPVVEEMMEQGLIAVSDARVLRVQKSGAANSGSTRREPAK